MYFRATQRAPPSFRRFRWRVVGEPGQGANRKEEKCFCFFLFSNSPLKDKTTTSFVFCKFLTISDECWMSLLKSFGVFGVQSMQLNAGDLSTVQRLEPIRSLDLEILKVMKSEKLAMAQKQTSLYKY